MYSSISIIPIYTPVFSKILVYTPQYPVKY